MESSGLAGSPAPALFRLRFLKRRRLRRVVCLCIPAQEAPVRHCFLCLARPSLAPISPRQHGCTLALPWRNDATAACLQRLEEGPAKMMAEVSSQAGAPVTRPLSVVGSFLSGLQSDGSIDGQEEEASLVIASCLSTGSPRRLAMWRRPREFPLFFATVLSWRRRQVLSS